MFAPDLQASYIEFGCNTGNVYVVGIDKGSYNNDVQFFKDLTGVEYPGVSGFEGGGNNVHELFQIQSTPSIVIVRPDRSIAAKHIYPPAYQNVVDSILYAGGVPQSCITGSEENKMDVRFTISPNPVRQKARILWDQHEEEVLEIEVYSSAGRLLEKINPELLNQDSRGLEIDFSDVRKGLYFLRVKTKSENVITRKFLVH